MYTGISELMQNYPELKDLEKDILQAADITEKSFRHGGKLLLCGNGGSAADCLHIAGELMKGFAAKRTMPAAKRQIFFRAGLDDDFCSNFQEALPAIALTGQDSLNTAILNDLDPAFLYAQQVYGLGRAGDILWAFSTSGNAGNVRNAVLTAKAAGIVTLAFTGNRGGWLGEYCDYAIRVPAQETWRIQELHLPVYHAICRELERRFFEHEQENEAVG